MHLFFTPDISGDFYSLDEEESRHCTRVLRLSPGDLVHLTDGAGNLWEAEITSISGKHCLVRRGRNIGTVGGQQSEVGVRYGSFGYRNYYLHIAIAPTKNIDRFEWFLEKVTEIGIDEITPLICEHSERRQLRTDRLEKVITSAMKQSLKAWHPKLNEPVGLKNFILNREEEEKFMAYLADGVPLLQSIYPKGKHTVILIGPEGDFSQSEVDAAMAAGFSLASLGNNRLRTETAGVVACHTLYLVNTV